MIKQNVSFPSNSIDRTTPATDDELYGQVEEAIGAKDHAPVVTEPFAS